MQNYYQWIQEVKTNKKEEIKMISIVVTKAKNNIIGKNNELVCDIPNDRKRYEKY